MENSLLPTPKKYWSKTGVILGIIFVIINIILSIGIYNNPAITHPEGFSDFMILAYPNALLGLPIIYFGPGVLDFIFLVSRQENLFIQIFIFLSIYWFFIGTFIAWIYNKLPKVFKIFFVVIIILIVLGVGYLDMITFFPVKQQTPVPVLPHIDNNEQSN